jgi:predicted ATPase/DNA-binding SARP family transcriptional activator/tetratricopeptide (TPR) repeat protein
MAGQIPKLNVFLFGVPRIELDEQPIPLNRRKAQALLAYLCVETHPHSRDSIIDLLWPLFEPEDGRNNLRRELSILKKQLEVDILQVNRVTVGVDSGALESGLVEVDILRFESLISKVTRHDENLNQLCPDCVDYLNEALDLYTDDFLAGFSLPDSTLFDEWHFFQAERLRRMAMNTLDQLVEWHQLHAEFEPAIEYSRRRLTLDPLHEPAHRTLMTLYAQFEQPSAALRQFETLKRLMWEELKLEPEASTQDLYEAIHARRFEPPQSLTEKQVAGSTPVQSISIERPGKQKPASTLPTDTTPFIGRQSEIAYLQQLLSDPDVRLVTIMGIGGMGKTRLALATGKQIFESALGVSYFSDGIYFVSLAAVDEFHGMATAISLNLGLTPAAEQDQTQQLIDHLRTRQILLILDNVEHLVVSEVNEFLQELLISSPKVKLLTTSRVKLGLRGEHLFSLEGLMVPDADSALDPHFFDQASLSQGSNGAGFSAITLFVTAGRRVKPDFDLTPSNVATIVNICHLVQGMPLGIELAAGWLGLLRPEAIAAEIEQCLDFLETDLSDFPDRQSSLKAVFDSSWKLLSPPEQEALAQLTVFRGGFTRQAAEQVTGTGIRVLLSLTNKSWLQQIADNRYQIHELLRQFARQELESLTDISRDLNERYAHYYASYIWGLVPEIKGPHPSLAFKAITYDLDNILASLEWLIKEDQITVIVDRMMTPLFHYMESRYHYFLFLPLFQIAGQRAEQLKLTRELGILLIFRTAFFITGFPTRFLDYPWINTADFNIVRETQEFIPEAPDKAGFWAILQAWHYGRFGDVVTGVAMLRELLNWYIAHDWLWEAAFALQSLGRLLILQQGEISRFGDERESQICLRQSRHEFEALGDVREAAISLFFIGLEQQRNREYAEAKNTILEAQDALRNLGEDIIAANSYWQLADIHMSMGEPGVSLKYLHEMGEFLVQRGRLQLATMALSRQSYESVRYGDLADALKIREYSLQASLRFQDDFLIAWDYWEMGEIYRVKGDLLAARQWFDRSIAYFEKVGASVGNTFYFRGLGDLALAKGDFNLAKQHFSDGIEWARRTFHPWQEAYISFGLGKAELGSGDLDKSRHYLAHGLRLALADEDAGGLVLMGIVRVAKLYQATGGSQRVDDLIEIILSHPLSWHETRREAASLIGLDINDLPDNHSHAMVDLEPVIGEILADLEAQKPPSPE